MGRRVKITLPENTQKEVTVGEKTIKIDSYISLEKYDAIINDIKEVVLCNSKIENKMCCYVTYTNEQTREKIHKKAGARNTAERNNTKQNRPR